MTIDLDSLELHDNPAAGRLEVPLGDTVAEVQYMRVGNTLIFTHTEVPEAYVRSGDRQPDGANGAGVRPPPWAPSAFDMPVCVGLSGPPSRRVRGYSGARRRPLIEDTVAMTSADHPWDLAPADARALQNRLRSRVIVHDQLAEVGTIAGVDVGFEAGSAVTRAAVAVLAFPSLEPLTHAVARRPTRFPYPTGLLSFREVPAILDALEKLAAAPDLILCDGQGYAHPRRFGLACHLGVLTGLATIGVGKTRLIGRHGPLPDRRGAWVPLEDRDEVVGAVLRSRAGVKPIFVSIGHRISLPTALHYVMAVVGRYKLPETTRRAHRLASGPPR